MSTAPSDRDAPGSRGRAGALETIAVAVAVLAVWRLLLGADWSSVPTDQPNTSASPQDAGDWVVAVAAASLAAGWLALRGRPFAGLVAVCLPLLLFAGWRMAAAEVIGANLWPIGLAALALALALACGLAVGVGRALRRAGRTGGRPAR